MLMSTILVSKLKVLHLINCNCFKEISLAILYLLNIFKDLLIFLFERLSYGESWRDRKILRFFHPLVHWLIWPEARC